MDPQAIVIGIGGLGALALGAGIFHRQGKAASCPLHRRWVGALALVLGTVLLVGGLALLAWAAVLVAR